MPEFYLRSWCADVLFGSNDYRVTASTIEEAVKILEDAQEKADRSGDTVEHDAIRQMDLCWHDVVSPLSAEETVREDNGIVLLDQHGYAVRDLRGVPTGCVQLGQQLGHENDPPKLNLLSIIKAVVERARAIDKVLDDPRGDGSGIGAQPPTGDSYNELWDSLMPLFEVVDSTSEK